MNHRSSLVRQGAWAPLPGPWGVKHLTEGFRGLHAGGHSSVGKEHSVFTAGPSGGGLYALGTVGFSKKLRELLFYADVLKVGCQLLLGPVVSGGPATNLWVREQDLGGVGGLTALSQGRGGQDSSIGES